ncbi:7908_t:CDS:2, partial [Acaulospora colombiana]
MLIQPELYSFEQNFSNGPYGNKSLKYTDHEQRVLSDSTNMQLLDQLLKFMDILSSAKTSSVSQWNIERLQNAIQCAMDVENEMFMIPEEDVMLITQQLVSKVRSQPPNIPDFGNAHHLLYGTLLKNVYLSSELFSYIMSTYEFPLEGLFSKKDNISE